MAPPTHIPSGALPAAQQSGTLPPAQQSWALPAEQLGGALPAAQPSGALPAEQFSAALPASKAQAAGASGPRHLPLEHAAEAARAGHERLCEILHSYQNQGGVLVAFSGGVDSSYLLHAAREALGPQCHAAIAVSESLAQAELQGAREIAQAIGVALHEVRTAEMNDPNYVRNHADRCYFCKKALFVELDSLAKDLGVGVVAYGSMADDVGDHRPGARAAAEHAVRAPLQEAGLGKDAIRWLSREAGLSTWNLPAQACLSSRFAYGQAIDPVWLRAIEQGEAYLRSLGFYNVRVRHSDRTARLEVDLDELPRLVSPEIRTAVLAHLRSLGYLYVTVDLAGFRSGSGNLALGTPAIGGQATLSILPTLPTPATLSSQPTRPAQATLPPGPAHAADLAPPAGEESSRGS